MPLRRDALPRDVRETSPRSRNPVPAESLTDGARVSQIKGLLAGVRSRGALLHVTAGL